MKYVIPEKIGNYNVYNSGNKLLGLSDEVTLPEIAQKVMTLSGPGILGDYESPVKGMFEKMEMEIPFRTLYDDAFDLLSLLTYADLTLRASVDVSDGKGGRDEIGMRVVVRGDVKNFNPGKAKIGEGTGSSLKFSIAYIKIEIDGKERLEIDIFNSIYRVNGKDMLAKTRSLC